MAWTDQCRLEAVRQVDHKVAEGMPVREALKSVSAESEIPAGTLKRWKYPEKSVPKNGNKKTTKPKTTDQKLRDIVHRLEKLIDYIETHEENPDQRIKARLFAGATMVIAAKYDCKDMGIDAEKMLQEASEMFAEYWRKK